MKLVGEDGVRVDQPGIAGSIERQEFLACNIDHIYKLDLPALPSAIPVRPFRNPGPREIHQRPVSAPKVFEPALVCIDFSFCAKAVPNPSPESIRTKQPTPLVRRQPTKLVVCLR